MTPIQTIKTSTFTPIRLKRTFQWNAINGHRSASPEPLLKRTRSKLLNFQREQRPLDSSTIPAQQTVFLLHGKGQRYAPESKYIVLEIKDDRELLVKIQYTSLNLIDWKSAGFGFGIPELPYIAGRDLVRAVVRESQSDSRFKLGDVVFTASTDHRDLRKSVLRLRIYGCEVGLLKECELQV
ncbi:hypothetical protein G7Y89_g3574 [Cudoniella acicularis]|uniref:Alcohol dehydrogenase-like N-terminal domain-containing protein n=1 Tax=Cudoniella acicularis TaxID=354080 RepID=A0A8H4RT67_9HELO|nr:hypothetical protein G7Y89_g3574 [Cudoniella acicularis]